MIDWIDRLFNQYKFVRRFMIFWMLIIVTCVLCVVYSDLAAVTTPVASVTVSVVGLVATVGGFYFMGRKDK